MPAEVQGWTAKCIVCGWEGTPQPIWINARLEATAHDLTEHPHPQSAESVVW